MGDEDEEDDKIVTPPSIVPWSSGKDDPFGFVNKVAFICSLLTFVYAFTLLKFFKDESNPSSVLPYVPSPCGSSSCSQVTYTSSVVYNAIGFFSSSTFAFESYRPTVCVYEQCDWADGNSLPIRGFPPLNGSAGLPNVSATPCFSPPNCLATTRPEDWPNPGIGLPNGIFPGFATQISPIAQCPGVRLVGTEWVGQPACSYCLQYWRDYYGYTGAPNCPAAVSTNPGSTSFWCQYICPQPWQVRTPEAMAQTFKQTVGVGLTYWVYIYAFRFVFVAEWVDFTRSLRRKRANGGY
jgi:hypothetical protein